MSRLLECLASEVPELVWPRLLSPDGSTLLGLLHQLDKTHYLPADHVRQLQMKQACNVLKFARHSVPYYAEALKGVPLAELSREEWSRLPILTRKDIQKSGTTLVAFRPPPGHGTLRKVSTSGSTGMPITCFSTDVTYQVWLASSLLEHFWHDRDPSGTHLTIRPSEKVPPGEILRGKTWARPVRTGPSLLMNARTKVAVQFRALQKENPSYLLSLPSNLKVLADLTRQTRSRLSALKGIRCYGEVLSDDVRKLCEDTWGVKVTDVYSSQEIGNIAFQCQEEGQLHLLCDSVLIEVLREDGTVCSPGETGRVVVTTLLNFAGPLIRYALGDYAVVGDACRCGRTSPVLAKVLGRQRNMLHLPDGGMIWPSFSVRNWARELPLSQFQFVQTHQDVIEARLVAARPLSVEEEGLLVEALHERLQYPFKIEIRYFEEIPRSRSGKYEDFMSEIG